MLEEQAVRVELDMAKMSGKLTVGALKKLFKLLIWQLSGVHHGEQSLKALNRQGRALESVDLADKNICNRADLQEIKRQLKSYAVDFTITKSADGSKLYLWFKGQDVERIQEALKNCIAKKASPKMSIRDICAAAKEKAAALNAALKAKAHSRERGERT